MEKLRADILNGKVLDLIEGYVLNVEGKGAKNRVVPISASLAKAIIDWQFLASAEGLILRNLGRNKDPGESISTTGLYNIVQKRGAMIKNPSCGHMISGALRPSWDAWLVYPLSRSVNSWGMPISRPPRNI